MTGESPVMRRRAVTSPPTNKRGLSRAVNPGKGGYMKIVHIYWRSGGQTKLTVKKTTDILAAYMDVIAYIKEITETDVETQEVTSIYKMKVKTPAETV